MTVADFGFALECLVVACLVGSAILGILERSRRRRRRRCAPVATAERGDE